MKHAPRPTAFLPVITKARELEARALLASHLLNDGYRVVIGRSGEVNRVALRSDDGLYFSPLLVRAAAPRLQALKRRGHVIIAWDEEGLVYPDPAWYFANRVSADAAQHADALIAWGPIPGEDLAATLPPKIGATIQPLGNARIDLLRAPYRSVYDAEARALRERFGRYVLVNTNFDLVNHADGPGGLERRMRTSGRIASARDETMFADWAVFRQAVFDAFRQGLPLLHDTLPDVTLVLRPHPSEDLAPWRALAEDYPRIVLAPPAGPVYPWILGAAAVLHNSCTTAVEAFMFGVPVVAFHPAADAGAMDSPLPNQLSKPAYSWEEASELLRRAVHGNSDSWTDDSQIRIADASIGGRTGVFSSEAIVRLARTLGAADKATRFASDSVGIRSYRALRRRVGRLVRPEAGRDDRSRFPGLSHEEMSRALDRFRGAEGRNDRISTIGPDLFLLEPQA